MPVLSGNHQYDTVADVNSRVRSAVNDNNGQLYPDGSAALLNAVRNAYNWLYGQIVRLQGQPFTVTISDVAYTPGVTAGQEENISGLLPIDMYMPITVYYRLNTSEEYREVSRRQRLLPRTQQAPDRVVEWEFRGNTIFVIAPSQPGMFRFSYTPLLANVALVTDPILINNAKEAIANYAAYELFQARGQMINASARLGNGEDPGKVPTGAKGFAALVLDHLILNEQEIPRRGARFAASEIDLGGWFISTQP